MTLNQLTCGPRQIRAWTNEPLRVFHAGGVAQADQRHVLSQRGTGPLRASPDA